MNVRFNCNHTSKLCTQVRKYSSCCEGIQFHLYSVNLDILEFQMCVVAAHVPTVAPAFPMAWGSCVHVLTAGLDRHVKVIWFDLWKHDITSLHNVDIVCQSFCKAYWWLRMKVKTNADDLHAVCNWRSCYHIVEMHRQCLQTFQCLFLLLWCGFSWKQLRLHV